MADVFQFEANTPLETEDPVYAIKLYAGAVLVDEVVLSTLTPVDGVYTWESTLADPNTQYTLIPVSQAGVPGLGAILAPRPAESTRFTLFVHVKDLGLAPKAGVRFQAYIKQSKTPAGYLTAQTAGSDVYVNYAEATTGADGYAELELPSDVGTLLIKVDDAVKEIDTADLGGTSVNLAGLL